LDFDLLERLMRLFEASALTELEIEEQGWRVRLNKGGTSAAPVIYSVGAALPQSAPPGVATPHIQQTTPTRAEPEDSGLVTIDSPIVGTFYRSSAPGKEPFVKVGDKVELNQVVGIVEAMKIMNDVPATVAGIIEKILVENGEPVEYGQPLFAVRPTEK
jgi:acetyl-CoA carboxylase biotin carboxyl carrier protein